MATKTKKTKEVAVKDAVVVKNPVIGSPRITEKATMLAERGNVYTFNVARTATKPEIAKAVKALYKVTPIKVSIVTLHPRKVVVRGKRGMQSGGKKALVYLKKGDKLSLV